MKGRQKPPLRSEPGYPSTLKTVEISTRTSPIGTISRNRKRNFLPHNAMISTEIGEFLKAFIAEPPSWKAKSPSAATVGLFALLALPHGSVIAGIPRKFCTAGTVACMEDRREHQNRFSPRTTSYRNASGSAADNQANRNARQALIRDLSSRRS